MGRAGAGGVAIVVLRTKAAPHMAPTDRSHLGAASTEDFLKEFRPRHEIPPDRAAGVGKIPARPARAPAGILEALANVEAMRAAFAAVKYRRAVAAAKAAASMGAAVDLGDTYEYDKIAREVAKCSREAEEAADEFEAADTRARRADEIIPGALDAMLRVAEWYELMIVEEMTIAEIEERGGRLRREICIETTPERRAEIDAILRVDALAYTDAQRRLNDVVTVIEDIDKATRRRPTAPGDAPSPVVASVTEEPVEP